MDFNLCPELDFSLVTPREIGPGVRAHVLVEAEDPEGDELSYRWRASSGSFSEGSRPATRYVCTEPGWQVLVVTVTDHHDCATERGIDVLCLDE